MVKVLRMVKIPRDHPADLLAPIASQPYNALHYELLPNLKPATTFNLQLAKWSRL